MNDYKMTPGERRATWGLGTVFSLRMLGMFMVLPVLTTYGMALQGASEALIGIAIGIYGLTQAVFQIPFGLLSDRIGRKPLIVGGLAVFAAGSVIAALSDFQVNQLLDILRAKLLKRGIEGSSLDVPENIVHSGKTWFVEAKLKQGIESATQKKIVKMIKDSKLKVQAQIQGDEIRVTGKSRDDLQAVMAMVRGGDLGQPFQFKNFRD